MATDSSTLAWKISWTEEPGGLQSLGSHRVGQDSVHAQQSVDVTSKGRGRSSSMTVDRLTKLGPHQAQERRCFAAPWTPPGG